MERVIVKNKLIKKAKEDYKYLTGDAEKRRWAELDRRYYADMSSAKSAGFIDGKKEDSINIAKAMSKKGFNKDMILDLTDLSLEEIEKIKI